MFYLDKENFNASHFTQKFAIKNRGRKNEVFINNISLDMQKKLINDIFKNTFNIIKDGQKEIILNIGDGQVQNIERNYKNFKTILKIAFKNLTIANDYETIELEKLFEVIKSRKNYNFLEARSIFFVKNAFEIDNDRNILKSKIKIKYDFNIDIDKKIYNEIVIDVNKHWNNNIDIILDFIVAGQYSTDKKNLWLLILAPSNFGKSKIFKWMEPFGGAVFTDFENIGGGGISDKQPADFDSKLCLVIDEVMSFPRYLFNIEDYINIRPMRNHIVPVAVGSRIMLSADGGIFNHDFLDKQIQNRVVTIDFRNTNTCNLNDIETAKKYGQYQIQKVMSYYLYLNLSNKLKDYRILKERDRADRADNVIKKIFETFKKNKKNFFEKIKENIFEIFCDITENLSSRVLQDVGDSIVYNFIYKGTKGIILKRANQNLKKILIDYDSTLEYELKYKELSQIAKECNFVQKKFKYDGKTINGLFIPFTK